MLKITAVLLLVAAVFAGCSDDNEPTQAQAESATSTTSADATTTTTEAEPAVSDEADPYEIYLVNAPAGEETLSREDAQARAYLGCGQEWAPGTVDRALADAYRPTGICG